MTLYILAEPQEPIFREVFSGKWQKPQIDYLFTNIDTALPKELSPLLIQDNSVSKQQLQQLLEKYSGLLITTNYSKEQLLDQLRHNLIVYFKPDQVGVFRYYDPYIATYFFPSLSEQETLSWLGPIASLEWFNTDWRHKANQPDQWQEKHNSQVNNWQEDANRLSTKPVLTKNQLLALEDMQEEKFAYRWQQNIKRNTTGVDINTAIYWVKEAIHIGCRQDQELERYLHIRAQHPTKPLPEQWTTQDIHKKLIDLEHHFQIIA